LLSKKSIILSTTFTGNSGADQEILKQSFETLDPTCGTNENAVVVCDQPTTSLLYKDAMISIYVDSHDTLQYDSYEATYDLVIANDTVYLIGANQILYQETLANIPGDWTNIDFSTQTTDSTAFYNRIFSGLDDVLLQTKIYWAPTIIFFSVISSVLLFLIFILLSAWMLKMRFKEVPYRQFFAMTVYSYTGLYVLLILNNLYNLNFILVILLLIVLFRQNNQLSMEIMKRLDKKP